MRTGQAMIGFLIILLGIIQFPLLLNAFDSMSYREVSTTATVITTEGQTTGDVTLGNPLYNKNLDNVLDITSTYSSDAPAPAVYSSGTDTLTVSGLAESQSRALTVNYRSERTDSYLSSILPFTPFLLFFLLVIVGALTLWEARK